MSCRIKHKKIWKLDGNNEQKILKYGCNICESVTWYTVNWVLIDAR